MFTCVLWRCCFYSHISTRTFRRALTASLDSSAEKEYPFSGVTKSGRVWRKVPESDARSVAGPSRKPRRDQEQGGGAGPSRQPRRDQEEGGVVGLSQSWTILCFSYSSTVAFWTLIVFVALFRTAVETAVSEVHKLLRTGGVLTSLTLLFWRWLTVSSVFTGRSARTCF